MGKKGSPLKVTVFLRMIANSVLLNEAKDP